MNIVVPQQVKDRFSEVQGQVQGKVVALGQLATNNYAELHKRFDQLPESWQQLWTGVRARLQLLLMPLLGARRRGQGLASVLESLAESVAADVRARRAIEADRAKPRTTARWVTIITISVLGFLTLTGDYISPYGSPLGQLLLILLLSAYVGLLIWMRNMAKGEALPRFLGDAAREGAHA